MTERVKTVILTFASGLIGALTLYSIAPVLFGVAVLLANHRFIKFKLKIVAYVLVIPMSFVIFQFGGLFLSALAMRITGFISESISIYVGSGLCALTMAFIFELFLENMRLSISTSVLIFVLGIVSLLISFVVVGHRLDNLFRGFDFDNNFPVLVSIWQTLVGIGISFTLRNYQQQKV